MDVSVDNSLSNGDLSSDLMAYSEICENIRQNMTEVIKLKNNSNKGDDKKAEVIELRMQGSFNFLSLKQLNRAAQIRCKNVKDQTLEAKQKLDGYNLQLENLQYEISHLHKEITKCLEFRSRHDDISLVPVEEFYENAPNEISSPETTKADIHKQTLSRLDYELQQRKLLADKLQELKKLRENIANDIGAKKQNIQMLAPALQNLLKASLPLQEAFDIPIDDLQQQHTLARLLPRPLFVLYLQAKGYQEACDPQLIVSIDGDTDLANKFQEATAQSNNVPREVAKGEDTESEPEEVDDQDSGRKHKRKKVETVAIRGDDADGFNALLSSHPLTVTLKLNVKEMDVAVTLTFSHLTTLNVITVKSKLVTPSGSGQKDKKESSLMDDNMLLCCITESDFGLESPNPSNKFLLGKSSSNLSDVFEGAGRPYIWAQNLCGLVFLPDQATKKGQDMQISFNHIQQTITSITKRVISRIRLTNQVERLSKNMVTHDGENVINLPTKIHSYLTSWAEISLSDYRELPHTAPVINLGILGSNDEASCHRYYAATIKRGSSVTLDATVIIFNDYPTTVPLITIALQWRGRKTAANDQNIQEMEAELNVRWPKNIVNNDILTLQIMKLMVMLDLYVETDCDVDESTQPVEFTLSKVCPQKVIGPSRLKPFLYQAATKTFVHRSLEED